ncbi:hypothetical protein TI39_contig315g00011 [Zymoseptoria brevis]|uniref:Uncharacterized protein n=1 Tax=Zymoseptoria brevis TaxID=1047168 RepID=A0A0F4GTF2_9PEZI|nr:hypothetical protein TI39_contig315g00011 [Zymoseptoria brevis]
MAYLFRTYSDQSNGFNDCFEFKPASAIFGPAPDITLEAQLIIALSGKLTAPHNPYIFWTISLHLALQLAHKRHAAGEMNIRIAFLDVKASRNPAGGTLQFEAVASFAAKLGLPLKKDTDGTPRGLVEFVTMDSVVMKGNSRTASFDALVTNGLYKLYPSIKQAAGMRSGPGFNLELRLLQQLYYDPGRKWSLSRTKIALAAKIASAFVAKDANTCKVATQVLGFFLSLQNRDMDDQKALRAWLKTNTKLEVIDLTEVSGTEIIDITHDSEFDISNPELDTFRSTSAILKGRTILDSVLGMCTTVPERGIRAEVELWHKQHEENYAAHRASKPLRGQRGFRRGAKVFPDHARQSREFSVRKPRTEVYKQIKERRY